MSFRNKVTQAIEEAKKVLGTARTPLLPSECSHTYDDKYLLAEIATRTALLGLTNALDQATNNSFTANLPQMILWAQAGKTVTLHTDAEELCTFKATTHRDIKSNTSRVTERSGVFGGKTESFTVTKVIGKCGCLCSSSRDCYFLFGSTALSCIRHSCSHLFFFGVSLVFFFFYLSNLYNGTFFIVTEHEWNFQVNWETYVYPADDIANSKIVLQSSTSTSQLTTRGDTPVTPRPAKCVGLNSRSYELSWLLKALDTTEGSNQVVFTIDRSNVEKCHTPRRNPQIEQALASFASLNQWSASVQQYLTKSFRVNNPNLIDGQKILSRNFANEMDKSYQNLFDPIPATFVLEESAASSTGSASTTLTPNDIELILKRQNDVYTLQVTALMSSLEAVPSSMYDKQSITHLLGCAAIACMKASYTHSVMYIEDMLEKQLISAIGKVVQPSHFAEYMNYHHRNLFATKYAPKGFCHAVRRPNHYPEGTLSLEQRNDKGEYQPVPCMTAHRSTGDGSGSGAPAMSFPLNAASDLTFFGDQYLHSFVVHQFSRQMSAPLRLAARARQFSSFILMVGTMSGPSSFAPESAIIVQNKDDLLIPLCMETIPTPKEFKDAIESLSPEQQRFAKAFRSMQLNSTLFGIVVIQIKPQLERVLNLPFDSL